MSDAKVEAAKVRDALAQADDLTIREIVRQGEVFLSAQLQAGLAADSRSMTTAAILAAVLSFLVGGTASLLAAKLDLGWHALTDVFLIVMFGIAMLCAIFAARPTKFDYAGSNPKFWVPDIQQGYTFQKSMAGQAAQYAAGIQDNITILDRGQSLLRRALDLVVFALLGAILIEAIIFIDHWAKTGHFF
jgi:hypothetical protein